MSTYQDLQFHILKIKTITFSPKSALLSMSPCHPSYNSTVLSLISASLSYLCFMNKAFEREKYKIGLHCPIDRLLNPSTASSSGVSLSSFPLGPTTLAFPSQKTQLLFQVPLPLGSPSPIFTPPPYSFLLSLGVPPVLRASIPSTCITMHVFRTVHLIISEIRMSPRWQSQCSYCSLSVRDLCYRMFLISSLQLSYKLCCLKYFKSH